MKKFIAAAAAVAMVFAMSFSAFAAESVKVESDANLAIDPIVDESRQSDLVDEINGEEVTKLAEEKGVDVETMNIIGFYEFDPIGNHDGKVVLAISGVDTTGKNVVAFHKGVNGWEVVVGVLGEDDKYTFQFDGFSPVVLALADIPAQDTTTPPAGDGTQQGGADAPAAGTATEDKKADATTAPKTGDFGAVAVIVNALA